MRGVGILNQLIYISWVVYKIAVYNTSLLCVQYDHQGSVSPDIDFLKQSTSSRWGKVFRSLSVRGHSS